MCKCVKLIEGYYVQVCEVNWMCNCVKLIEGYYVQVCEVI